MAADIAILCAALVYNPESGRLFWKERPQEHFKTWKAYRHWNSKYPGTEALTHTNSAGYKAGNVAGVGSVLAHRVIWAILHGEWPAADIDHINHDRSDNRITNLRAVSRAENARNLSAPKKTTNPYAGVQWKERLNKWCVLGSDGNRRLHLGTFACLADAVRRRKQFEREHGFHENHCKALAA